MNYTLTIFDMDGTLLDTLPGIANAVNTALSRNSFPERSLDEIRTFVGNGAGKLIRRALPRGASLTEFLCVLIDFYRIYAETCAEHTVPYPGIADMLHSLRAAGVATAVVTNKPAPAADKLTQTFFSGLVDVCVGAQGGLKHKPAPDMVQLALSKTGHSAENAVYVGDSDVDLATAQNCGMPCLPVGWGYCDEDRLKKAGAGHICRTAAELEKAILQ